MSVRLYKGVIDLVKLGPYLSCGVRRVQLRVKEPIQHVTHANKPGNTGHGVR